MCVCGKWQRLAQPKTQRRAHRAEKELLAGLGLSWHLGTWVSGGLPPFQEPGREHAQIVHTVWFLLSAGFPSGGLEFGFVRGSRPLTQPLNTETPRSVLGGPHATHCPSVAWEDLCEDCVAAPERESRGSLETADTARVLRLC